MGRQTRSPDHLAPHEKGGIDHPPMTEKDAGLKQNRMTEIIAAFCELKLKVSDYANFAMDPETG